MLRSLPRGLVVSLVIVATSIVYTAYVVGNQPAMAIPEATTTAPIDVNVIDVRPGPKTVKFYNHAEAKSQFELSLASELTGKVIALDPNFEAGRLVKKGQLLVKIGRQSYRREVDNAIYEVAMAELKLAEERRNSKQAIKDWKGAKLEINASPQLVKRQPQIKAAKTQLQRAKSLLAEAQYNLDNTSIRAPFDAIIVERTVSPGQLLTAGSKVGLLYSMGRIDINFKIPKIQWPLLKAVISESNYPAVTMQDSMNNQWQGRLQSLQHHIDPNSRQRSAVVSLERPFDKTPALLPGTFLKLTLSLNHKSPLLEIPPQSIGPNGWLWYVDKTQRLAHFKPEVIATSTGALFIKPPVLIDTNPLSIIALPQPSFVLGLAVTKTYAENENRYAER